MGEKLYWYLANLGAGVTQRETGPFYVVVMAMKWLRALQPLCCRTSHCVQQAGSATVGIEEVRASCPQLQRDRVDRTPPGTVDPPLTRAGTKHQRTPVEELIRLARGGQRSPVRHRRQGRVMPCCITSAGTASCDVRGDPSRVGDSHWGIWQGASGRRGSKAPTA